MGLSKTSPETLNLIPQMVKQEMAVMFKLKIIFRLLGMGARLRVETGQMEETPRSLKMVSTLWQ